jgi:hypothetical protein
MTKNLIQINYWEDYIGIRTLKVKYSAEIIHSGLNDYKILTDYDKDVLQNKVKAYVAKLEEKWDRIVQKKNIARSKEEFQNEADILTKEAIKALKEIDNLLLYALDTDSTIDWEKQKDKTEFSIPTPANELKQLLSAIAKPNEPTYYSYPNKPEQINYQPEFSLFDKIIKSKKESKTQQANAIFEKALIDWELNCKRIDTDNQNLKEQFGIAVSKYEKQR